MRYKLKEGAIMATKHRRNRNRNRCIIVLGSITATYLFIKSEVFRNTVTLVSALVMATFLIGGVVEFLLYFENPLVALLVSIVYLRFCIEGLCYDGKKKKKKEE